MLQLHCKLLYTRASIGLSLPAGVSSSTVRPDTTTTTSTTTTNFTTLHSHSLPFSPSPDLGCSFPSPPLPSPPSFAPPPSGFLPSSLSFFRRSYRILPSSTPRRFRSLHLPSTADLISCTTAILFAPEN
ncbi:uncharacterized protein BO95DRAFT_243405 [Aspergillus brunneoviolaceus CBS 621.78]|uniref:Uncharacterized protein n=1 Tax=Aspergillus brunneoviolaceus CBS 621.78 TaxID=1450534 RepID=A0ACD1FYV1_9EURO|nr:hypothetical protein BO95DRAFT_243405 [Aspergillus brunneoviolaceus CBS 621.78]RAH42143.1 hypothetical protein BO95DRAFT_243405 [Aspergillus brunneoviolaceus CBS 621.78]